jgi:hypothetical protein
MPVIVVVRELGVVMVAEGPLVCVHAPVPMEGLFAAMVAVPEEEHMA